MTSFVGSRMTRFNASSRHRHIGASETMALKIRLVPSRTYPNISNILSVSFREVRRVLKPDGTFWLNIGNTYSSGGRKWRDADDKNKGRAMSYRPPTPPGLKKKDLIGVAWLLALECQKDGWYLRNDIIWHKPNCQPESVKDRFTVSHEYLFMFSKSERYYFDQEAHDKR